MGFAAAERLSHYPFCLYRLIMRPRRDSRDGARCQSKVVDSTTPRSRCAKPSHYAYTQRTKRPDNGRSEGCVRAYGAARKRREIGCESSGTRQGGEALADAR